MICLRKREAVEPAWQRNGWAESQLRGRCVQSTQPPLRLMPESLGRAAGYPEDSRATEEVELIYTNGTFVGSNGLVHMIPFKFDFKGI